jgi:hypothetical protein
VSIIVNWSIHFVVVAMPLKFAFGTVCEMFALLLHVYEKSSFGTVCEIFHCYYMYMRSLHLALYVNFQHTKQAVDQLRHTGYSAIGTDF